MLPAGPARARAQHATQPRNHPAHETSTYHPRLSANGLAPDSVVMIWRRRRLFQERLCPPSLQKMRGCWRRDRVEPGARIVGGQWRERAAPTPNRARTGRQGMAVSRRGRQLARRQKTCTSAPRISHPNSGGSRAEPGRWELEGGTECLPRRLVSRGAAAAKNALASRGVSSCTVRTQPYSPAGIGDGDVDGDVDGLRASRCITPPQLAEAQPPDRVPRWTPRPVADRRRRTGPPPTPRRARAPRRRGLR